MAKGDWVEALPADQKKAHTMVYLKVGKTDSVSIACCRSTQPELYNIITIGKDQLRKLVDILAEEEK